MPHQTATSVHTYMAEEMEDAEEFHFGSERALPSVDT